jgi:hypothetical protein
MYIPKSQISKKITNGGLLKVKSTQQVYIGNYIKTSKNKYYAGHSNTNVGLELELITNNPQFLNPNTISESTIPISKFNILNKDIKSFLEKTNQIPTFKPTPSEENYTNGFIRRYFSKRINENKYIEISKKVFDSIKSKKGEYDHNLYSVGSLIWNIRGNDVHKSNSLSILSTQRSFPNIFTLFPILNEFLRPSSNIRENLETKGNELYFSDGTEYIGFYHIHPVQGPMEGATHSSTPHSKLYYTNQLPKFPDRSYEEFAAQYTPPVDPNMLVEPEESLVSPTLQRQPGSTATRDGITPSTPSTSPAPSAPSVLSTPSAPSGGGGGGY